MQLDKFKSYMYQSIFLSCDKSVTIVLYLPLPLVTLNYVSQEHGIDHHAWPWQKVHGELDIVTLYFPISLLLQTYLSHTRLWHHFWRCIVPQKSCGSRIFCSSLGYFELWIYIYILHIDKLFLSMLTFDFRRWCW